MSVMKEEMIGEFEMSKEELEGLIERIPQILQELEEWILQKNICM